MYGCIIDISIFFNKMKYVRFFVGNVDVIEDIKRKNIIWIEFKFI